MVLFKRVVRSLNLFLYLCKGQVWPGAGMGLFPLFDIIDF